MSVERMKVAIRGMGEKSGGNKIEKRIATVLPRQLLYSLLNPKSSGGLPPRSVRSTVNLKKLLPTYHILNDEWESGEASPGSTRATRVVFGALAEDRRFRPFRAVSDEGVENNTRRRVFSPRLLDTCCIRQTKLDCGRNRRYRRLPALILT